MTIRHLKPLFREFAIIMRKTISISKPTILIKRQGIKFSAVLFIKKNLTNEFYNVRIILSTNVEYNF